MPDGNFDVMALKLNDSDNNDDKNENSFRDNDEIYETYNGGRNNEQGEYD